MSEYKRLTNNNLEEYDPEYDFCIGCKYFGEPCGCNRPNGTCGNYDRFIETYNRLTELEDKIESGTLVELPFAVIDKQTKKEADEYKIVLEEDWVKDLCYCDIDGFAITQDGNIILLDECGKYTYCPYDRFEIIAEAELKELQENKK